MLYVEIKTTSSVFCNFYTRNINHYASITILSFGCVREKIISKVKLTILFKNLQILILGKIFPQA